MERLLTEFCFPLKELVVSAEVKEWCKLPYPRHLKGCPNYGKHGCPPNTPMLTDITEPPYEFVAVRFGFAEYLQMMRAKHPNWSEAQLRCCLYWQNAVDKALKKLCMRMFWFNPQNRKIVLKPEAFGVNLFETCHKHGILLERNPQRFVWKIALIGMTKR